MPEDSQSLTVPGVEEKILINLARGYYVSTVGIDGDVIRRSIRERETVDQWIER